MHVWTVQATLGAVTELGDHLRCEGIQIVTLESTSEYSHQPRTPDRH
jgi:hypothetical protein